jgi:choline kinase
MPDPIAVMLAAGRGLRMGGERPKTLIPMGRGEPLLHYILRGLDKAGVGEAVIVTGFMPEEIRAYVDARSDRVAVAYAHNAQWEGRGNYHSLRVGLEAAGERDVLVVNCDVVVHPDVYRRVACGAGDLVLAVQNKDDLDAEDMRVELTDGAVTAIGKGLEMQRSHGEYSGVSLLRPRAAAAYRSACDDVETGGDGSGYYEDVYALILDRVSAVPAEVGPGEYAEVDEPADVGDAVAVIGRYPGVWD